MSKPLIVDSSEHPFGTGVFEANQGIVGLGPTPDEGEEWWPTDGYDGDLYKHRVYIGPGNHYRPPTQRFAISGHSRREWLALADAMIERWQAWKQHIASLPDDPT